MLSTHDNAASTKLVAVVLVPCQRAGCSSGRTGARTSGRRAATAVAERFEPCDSSRTKLVAGDPDHAAWSWPGQSVRARRALSAWTRPGGTGHRRCAATRATPDFRSAGRRSGRSTRRNGCVVDSAGRRSGDGRGARWCSAAALRGAARLALARQRLGPSKARRYRTRPVGGRGGGAVDLPGRVAPHYAHDAATPASVVVG